MNGVNPRFDFSAPLPDPTTIRRVHLIAIGGAGMSAVARLLLAQGLEVSGSDARDSAVLEALRAAGAQVQVGHDAAAVAGVDAVVISSAIREDNVELAAARAAGIPVLHRSQALAAAAQGVAAAVAGANGKTTTASMLTVALRHAGVPASFALGGSWPVPGRMPNWTVDLRTRSSSRPTSRTACSSSTDLRSPSSPTQPDHLRLLRRLRAGQGRLPGVHPHHRTRGCSSPARTTRA